MFRKALVVVNWLVCTGMLHAATLVVDLNGGGDYTDLQSAIDAAADGDTVLVNPGEYVITEPISFKGKGITVRGEAGPEATTIRMAEVPTDPSRASVVIFENGETAASVLEGFALTGGRGIYQAAGMGSGDWAGGGIMCMYGSPTIVACIIVGNSAGRGGGLCGGGSSITNCTISGNSACEGGGVVYGGTLTNCIVWGNTAGAVLAPAGSLVITYSCIEGTDLYSGLGNINVDPQFCAWSSTEVWVDASHSGLGTGAQDDPFSQIGSALGGYRLCLSKGSPCLGTGEGGKNMGAAGEACESVGSQHLTVHLSPGDYSVRGYTFTQHVSIEGAGEETTSIQGTVYGLRTGVVVSGVTITSGADGGIVVNSGNAPEIRHCTIIGNRRDGMRCYGDSSPTLTDCTISGNYRFYTGGGVSCWDNSTPTLTNCTISGNWAIWGGGVACSGSSSPILRNCTLSGNSGGGGYGWGGGMFCYGSSSGLLIKCMIVGNLGSGVCCDSSTTLRNCTIAGNREHGVFGEGSVTLTNCVVWGNAGYAPLTTHECTVSFSCIETAEVWPGAGNINLNPLFCGWVGARDVYVNTANVSPGDGTEQNPFRELSPALGYSLSLQKDSPCIGAGDDGGNMGADVGVCDGQGFRERIVHVGPGRYSMEGLNCFQKASILGAGEQKTVLEGTVWGLRTGAVLSGVTVTNGKRGGIVVLAGDSPEISSCKITENLGGGVSCVGSPSLSSCTIAGNQEMGVNCGSGSSPTLTNCKIAGNDGFGIGCYPDSSATLTNCTIMGHRFLEGGMYCASSSTTLTNCTISGNFCGLSCDNASPTLTNCIVWGNLEGSVYMGYPAITYSCIAGEPVWVGEGNTNQDPLFVNNGVLDFQRSRTVMIGGRDYSLPDFIVEPPDYHLQAGSPAIDAAACESAPVSDIEGRPRPFGRGCDIGAYEYPGADCNGNGVDDRIDLAEGTSRDCNANKYPDECDIASGFSEDANSNGTPDECESHFKRGDTNADSRIDIADAVFMLTHLFAHGLAPSCRDAGDANDDGNLDIADAIAILSHLFAHGGPLPQPFGECGIDLSPNSLGCERFEPCERA